MLQKNNSMNFSKPVKNIFAQEATNEIFSACDLRERPALKEVEGIEMSGIN